MNYCIKWISLFSVLLLSACGAQEVELNVKLVGQGTINSAAGVDCSEPCVAMVKLSPPLIGNKRVKTSATPAPGFVFLGWNHRSCTDSEVCDIEFMGLCVDQLLCITGMMYFEETIRPVFVDASYLLDSGWSESAVCAAFSSGEVECWSRYQGDEVEQVPALNNPQQVAVGGNVACAQVDEGIHCWGFPNFLPQGAPQVYPPLEMEMLGSRICVLDQEGVKCWGTDGPRETPEFTEPANLRKQYMITPNLRGNQFCVDDAGEEKCWWG
ncbi:MAG: hypothetical protein D9N11_07975 [Ketobacter sp.]|nr:MAG: hypothetical protein D9N11_07975 [Ketobacter sp.]